jgi:hypothetical protein
VNRQNIAVWLEDKRSNLITSKQLARHTALFVICGGKPCKIRTMPCAPNAKCPCRTQESTPHEFCKFSILEIECEQTKEDDSDFAGRIPGILSPAQGREPSISWTLYAIGNQRVAEEASSLGLNVIPEY